MAKGQLVKGYVIQTWRADQAWYEHQDTRAYAPDGQLPPEWDQVQQDESIRKAVIFSTTQLCKQAQKRKLSGQFER